MTISRRSIVSCASLFVLTPAIAEAQLTRLVSVGSNGIQGNAGGGNDAAMTPDGRYVAFSSSSTNLVPADTNGKLDVFVRDLELGQTERVSVSSTGVQGNDQSSYPALSADGRFVAFTSNSTNLDPAHPIFTAGQVYLRDRQLSTTELVSRTTTGPTLGISVGASISRDGRFVAFTSYAALVPEDTNGIGDVYVFDRQGGTIALVSVSMSGAPAGGKASGISADGRFVAFDSTADDLVAGDTNGQPDVFVRDLQTSTTERVSVSTGGGQGNHDSGSWASISADGRFVVFWSRSSDLVPGDTNGCLDVFLRDRTLGTTERVSVSSLGIEGDADSPIQSATSADGRYVAFVSGADNLVPGDLNHYVDVFLRDRSSGTTERVSLSSAGTEGNGGGLCTVSDDGRFIAFSSSAHLVAGDAHPGDDVFVRDRTGGPAFTSLCSPGIDGVRTCPCANPPSGPDRGCDNSALTGGAQLTASGGSYVSSDTLNFHTSGEKPTATSILLQGTTQPSAGVVYGQGVRCAGGTLLRLFTRTASGGSVTLPNLSAGDERVTARSASKGDLIGPGQSRTYLVFYRDPTVLGGCPSSSTFNATQTGRIDWEP